MPQPAARPITKAAQRAATVELLIGVARIQFAEHGYAKTSTEDLVQRAGVTRGALYHHFKNKEDLFLAVLKSVQAEVAAQVAEAADAGSDAWEQLRLGCHAFMRAGLDPAVRQIMLVDGPAVVGWNVWRALDQTNSMRLLYASLEQLQGTGDLRAPSLEATVHLLSGAMNEAALWIAQTPSPETALAETIQSFDVLLESLHIQSLTQI